MKIKIIKNNRGFALLYAVMLSSIILAITLGIVNISLKEIKFSTSAKDTDDAFFAADTGAECALFNDKSTSFTPGGSGTVTCLGNAIPLSGTYPVQTFIISKLGSVAQGCVKVTVDKATYSPKTWVVSKGYNDGGVSCNPTPNTVERQLELTY